MSKVTRPDFGQNVPHATGEAVCWRCGKEWQAVWPKVPRPGHLQCDCGAYNHVPPATDEAAILMAIDAMKSAAASLDTLARELADMGKADAADLGRQWAKSVTATAKLVHKRVGATDWAQI